MRFSIWIGVLGCAAFGLFAQTAGAATLSVNGYTLGEPVNVIGSGRSGWVNTAELDVSLGGNGGYSYCVDLAQSIGVGATTGWELREAEASQGMIRAAWLVEHFRPGFDAGVAPRATAIAALQVAVWEVLAESPGSYDLYDGGFRLASGGASAGVEDLAAGFLAELDRQGANGFATDAIWAWHGRRQDQIVVNPIPEPSSMILFAAGAGLIAYAARRTAI